MTVTHTTPQGFALSWPGYSDASLLVTLGVGNDTWNPSADIMILHDALDELDTWLAAAGRPWFGIETFAVSAEWTSAGQVVAQVVCSTSATYTPDTDLRALWGWPASGQTATTIYSDPTVPSAVSCKSDLTGWLRRQTETGRFSRSGAYTIQPQQVAFRTPDAELVCDELQSALMTDAQIGASSPRTAYIYQEALETWYLVYVGRLDRVRSQMPYYRFTPELLG